MLDSKTLMEIVNKQLDVGRGTLAHDSITVGVVVDTDDPLQNGRLRVYCPNLNDSPKKLHHLPWAICASPLAGTTSNSSFTRGAGKGPENTEGAVSYGFWGIPEQGAVVLVAKIDGDARRRVWLGCIPSHQETHTLMHGRYKWEGGDGEPDGPLSSTCKPIEPYYTNAGKAFNDDRESREWKTRQAEYQACAVPEDGSIPAEGLDSYLDEQYETIAESERDEWVKDILGSHGYDWSSNKALGSFLSSKVYGWSTPGFHAMSMDDRAFNNRIRIRSATGHQLIFDDTNERIYLSTNEGNNFVEFDSNGNIDIYSKKRVSVHAEEDINFSTDESFRVKAKKGIYMYAGDETGQEALDEEKPEDGEIRFHSTGDTHMMVEKNLRTLVKEDNFMEVAKSSFLTIGVQMFSQIQGDVDFIINEGNHNLAVNGDVNSNTTGTVSSFAGNDIKMQATNDVEMFAYTGLMDIGSQLDMSVKSYASTITMEALKDDVKISANEGRNQLEGNSEGLSFFSMDALNLRSNPEVNIQCFSGFGLDADQQITVGGVPISNNCIRIPNAVNVKFDNQRINMDAVSDVAFKVASGISNVTSKTDLAVSTINQSLELTEEKLNLLSSTAYSYINDLVGFLGVSAPDFPWTPTVPIPQIPAINFDITFPELNLPEFNFDFCLDMGDIISIDRFNPLPDNGFLNINADLGGWTKDNITSWFDRQTTNFDLMVNSFDAADQISNNFDTEIDQVKLDLTQTRNALDNLVNVNYTDNVLAYGQYNAATTALRIAVDGYVVATAGNSNIPSIVPLQNEIENQSRTVKAINDLIQNDPSYNNEDFSELQSSVDNLDDILNRLVGVGS